LSAIWKIALCLAESYSLTFAVIYLWKLITVVPVILQERDRTKREVMNLYLAPLEKRATNSTRFERP
jgi:hypothetical protein